MPDWQSFIWVTVGVILSSIFPYAVTALFPSPKTNGQRGLTETAGEIFKRIWPGVRVFIFSLAVGAVVLVGAKLAGQELAFWWQAVLVGLAADRGVNIVRELANRKYE